MYSYLELLTYIVGPPPICSGCVPKPETKDIIEP